MNLSRFYIFELYDTRTANGVYPPLKSLPASNGIEVIFDFMTWSWGGLF